MSKPKQPESVIVTVKNWDKYQGGARSKGKAKSYDWFALSHHFFDDVKIWRVGALAQQVYLYILCECSKQNKSVIELCLKAAGTRLSLCLNSVRSRSEHGRNGVRNSLELLQINDLIEVNFAHNITEHNNEAKASSTEHTRAEAAAEDHPNVKKLPRPIDPFAPKPDETPYVEIINLWNQICGKLKRRIEPFQLGPIRQNNIKLFWTKHPDLAYWETWMQAYANSFWVLDPEQKNKPTNPEFDRLLEKTDLIYALLEGKYRYEDQKQKEFDARVAEVQAYLAGNGLGA